VENPFLTKYNTKFNAPPFDKIKEEHYLPAIHEGIKRHQEKIMVIVNNPEAPSFENTIEAMDISGGLLRNVNNVLISMNAALTNDNIQKISKEVAPLLSENVDNIMLNAKLFEKVKDVYDKKDNLELTTEQKMLLTKIYRDFVRGGALLDEDKKEELKEINKELAILSVQFMENILKENNAFKLVIEKKEDLAGLPEPVVVQAAAAAKESGHEGKWVFTLHKPSMIPFIQYSDKRALREKIFKAYINRGNNSNDFDNKDILVRMANLRIRKAALLGYKTHSHFILDDRMAKNPENVYELLNKVWKPAVAKAREEAKVFQEMVNKEGKKFKVQPWDWWYYAEKLKKAQYDLDTKTLKPYFQLEHVMNGAFTVANKLFGITFEERDDMPTYHDDVRVFEVKEADGSHVGLFYTDFYVRTTKNGGAWMDAYRPQSGILNATPIVYNVCNFEKPAPDQPSLLSLENVTTLFHEFGHALHGLLSQCRYVTLSGTSVPTDFVELPSQIMENWATEPEVLKLYARHYKTDEPIPQELVEKIKESSRFNQGFATTEYLAASLLDLDWHTLTEEATIDPIEFEKKALDKIGLIPEIISRYRSTYFAHIFSYGYSAGYYSYIWSEVLDADAFAAFKETSLFDRKTSDSFRKNILAAGGTEEPMTLYKRFRGAEPKIDGLLERKGFN
jgi:peptidyl-dipeptidase Dcp